MQPPDSERLKVLETKWETMIPNLATKTDLAQLETKLGERLSNIERDIAVIKTEVGHYATKAGLSELHANIQKDIRSQTWLIVLAVVLAQALPAVPASFAV